MTRLTLSAAAVINLQDACEIRQNTVGLIYIVYIQYIQY